MFCPNCGQELWENAAFCKNCGTQLKSTVSIEKKASPKKEIKWKRIGSIVAIIVAIFFLKSLFSGDPEINMVQNGVLNSYDYGIPIGDALHNWFHGTEEWDSFDSDGSTYVSVQGTTDYSIFQESERQTFLFRILDKEHFVFEGAYDSNGDFINSSNGNVILDSVFNPLNDLLSGFGGGSMYEITLKAAFGDSTSLKLLTN